MLEVESSGVTTRFPPHSALLQTSVDGSEEELTVLPRHTKVVVTGNNRTKSVLVGLEGVVKKAVGLGGWHWLVLTNGIEVKLQRNALTVLEPPNGNEEDDEAEFEAPHWNGSDMTSDDTQRSQKSRHRIHRPLEIPHQAPCRSLSPEHQSKTSPKVDLSRLEMGALWKYLRHFNLVDAIHIPSREQAVAIVQRHFMSQAQTLIPKACVVSFLIKQLPVVDKWYPQQQLDELQVICGFIQAAKKQKTTTTTTVCSN